jgi:hypothetical protein
MPETYIERLTLKLSGLSEDEARRLASLVSQGLAAASIPGQASGAGDIGALHVNVAARAGDSLDRTAQQVVAELLRQLAS